MPGNSPLARRTGHVDSDGERIYFEVTGSGPAVVLCHGLGGNHAIWWRQIEDVATDHQVVTWDQRGFGNSTARDGFGGPTEARRDLLAVLDHLGLDRAALVGQSMGGWAALGLAQHRPERVWALVLSTTLAGADREHVDRLVRAEPDRDRMNRREHPVLDATFCRANPALGVLYNQISSFGTRPDPATVMSRMAADRLDQLDVSGVTAPALVLMARDDELCPPSAMQSLVDRLPNARMRVVPGSHSAYYENPDAWNGALLEFLQSCRRPVGPSSA